MPRLLQASVRRWLKHSRCDHQITFFAISDSFGIVIATAYYLHLVSDRTEPDMSFELFEPDKSPVQLNPDFWPEPMNRTI